MLRLHRSLVCFFLSWYNCSYRKFTSKGAEDPLRVGLLREDGDMTSTDQKLNNEWSITTRRCASNFNVSFIMPCIHYAITYIVHKIAKNVRGIFHLYPEVEKNVSNNTSVQIGIFEAYISDNIKRIFLLRISETSLEYS